jgi:NAD(P)-dependent dehydrogenase (short-subunit alcohol dehydrogenase family)
MATLADRAAVIIGAGEMGALIARSLARRGAAVAVACSPRSGTAAVAAAVDEIGARGGQAVTVIPDLASWDGGERLIADVVDILGSVHILVICAGTTRSQSLAELTAEGWQTSLNSRLKSAVACAKRAANRMVQQGEGGSIITVASRTAFSGAQPSDAACMAGLMGLTSCMATTLEQHGITANCVLPAETDGEGERGETAQAAAELVAYLGDPGAAGITGQFISCSRDDITIYNRPLAMAGASAVVRNPVGWHSKELGDVIKPLLDIGRY